MGFVVYEAIAGEFGSMRVKRRASRMSAHLTGCSVNNIRRAGWGNWVWHPSQVTEKESEQSTSEVIDRQRRDALRLRKRLMEALERFVRWEGPRSSRRKGTDEDRPPVGGRSAGLERFRRRATLNMTQVPTIHWRFPACAVWEKLGRGRKAPGATDV